MELFFKYITPIIYWILVVVWSYIFIFYLIKINRKNETDKLLNLLLFILAIDAFRTLFESMYFGVWYTSLSGLIPIEIFNFLAKPQIVFFPKTINLITAFLVLSLLIKKWLPSEIKQKNKINSLVQQQLSELTEINKKLIAANKKTEESEERYKLAMNATKDGLYDWNLVTNEIYYSPGWKSMLGYKDEELANDFTIWENLTKPQDAKSSWEMQQEVIQKQRDRFEMEFKMRHKDGHWVDILSRAEPVFNEMGKAIRIVGTHVDITERKHAEEKIRLTEENTQNTFNLSPSIISKANINTGCFLEASPAVTRILGYSMEEFTSKSMLEFIHPDDIQKTDDEITLQKQGKEVTFFENRYLCKDGSYKWMAWRGTKPDKWGIVTAIGSDINERKLAELELIKAKDRAEESDRLKTEFINNMSHEIRTPMNGILGFSNFLNNDNLSAEKRKHYVKIIQSTGNQLMRIIDDIIEISKLGTKQVVAIETEVCLNDLCMELFSIFDIKAKENRTPLYLKKGLSDQESIIFIDVSKLNKILSNLLENALKYTNEGFIELGYQRNIKDRDQASQLEIYVKDTGIGISTDKQETVFERFSQEEKELSRKFGGLGLGLSIAKENAELLGGKITLESEKGKGSIFKITIPYKPVSDDKEKGNSNQQEIKTEKSDQYSILIVEDEEVNFLYLETLFEHLIDLNCTILHAKNGKEAVEICQENKDIHFVLMDIKMPVMNGFEATKQIKAFRPDLPIVAQTAYTSNEDRERAITAGCDDFISKPIDDEIFNEIINKYLIKKE